MDKEKLLEEIEETKKHLVNLEEHVKSIDENKKWKPKYDEEYYHIDSPGVVFRDMNKEWDLDYSRFSIGNYFKTKEGAEFEKERLKVLEELKEFSHEFSDEEWNDPSIEKYYIFYYEVNKSIDIDYMTLGKADLIYFKSEEDCYKATEIIGEERLKKYYFKI